MTRHANIRCPQQTIKATLGGGIRLLDRLCRTWRMACGDAAEPTAIVINSRSCRSAPSCFGRGFDGGKKINGVKVHLGVD
jgi:hypothetical protein